MELTDRERRALAEMENQFTTRRVRRLARSQPPPPVLTRLRPKWTLVPSAVLGFLLVAGGLVLGVGSAVLMGSLLLVWWLAPRLPGMLQRTGRLLAGSPPPTPPGGAAQ